MPRVPRLIASQVFSVFRPALLAYFLLSTINFVLGGRNICSCSGTLVISVLSAPFWFIFSLYLEEFCRKHRARAHGAVLPTTIPYRWPGGLDVLTSIARNKDAYIGEGPSAYSSILGPTFRLYTMFEGRVFTAEPAYIKSILATDFDNFEKGELNRTQMDVLLGDGVFNSDSDVWKFHRSMTRPFFNRDRISHFEIFNRHVDDSIAQAKRRMSEGYPFDFQDMVSRFTLDSATEFLLGKNVESLSAGLPYPHYADANLGHYNHPANVFTRAFVEAQSAVATRIRYSSLWTLLELGGEKARKHMEVIDAFVEPILAEAINRAKCEELDAKAEHKVDQADQDADTLLDHLVRFTRDPKMLKDETLNIMIAGRDTTASTLTFIVYMLSQHPHIMDRLYEEIHQLLPNNERPTFEDIKGMKYMRAVINETLRLYPPVPFNIRSATADTIWKSTDPSKPALFIPKGVRCILSPLLMHRRTDLWGPDALDFDPDRFLDERVHKYLVPNPFIFLPFNAGPRICLGQQFAYNEASFMLIRLVQEFSRIHLAPEAQPPETLPPAQWKDGPGRKAVEKIRLKSHLTMYSMGGLWVTMEERKSSP